MTPSPRFVIPLARKQETNNVTASTDPLQVQIHHGPVLVYLRDQRVIRSVLQAIELAHTVGRTSSLPFVNPNVSTSAPEIVSVVGLSPGIHATAYAVPSIRDRDPYVAIEAGPICWAVHDRMALQDLTDVWTQALTLGELLPGAPRQVSPDTIRRLRGYARNQHGLVLDDDDIEPILALARGDRLPWLEHVDMEYRTSLVNIASGWRHHSRTLHRPHLMLGESLDEPVMA